MIPKRNLRWGLSAGLFYAAFYSLFALIMGGLRGDHPASGNELDTGAVIATYFAVGIVGGAVLGILRPLVRSRWSAMMVGLVVAAPVTFGFGLLVFGSPMLWNESNRSAVVFSWIFFGLAGGNISWRQRISSDT